MNLPRIAWSESRTGDPRDRRVNVSPGVLSTFLFVAGLGFLCGAAWCVSRVFGLTAIGAALLAADYLSRPEPPHR